jgi:hypothetical protein
MLNLVVSDTSASLEFYRRLGLDVPEGAAGVHAQVRTMSGFSDVGLMSQIDESRRSWPPRESPDL